VLTYNLPLSELEGQGRAIGSRMSRSAGEVGEPWLSFFTPAEAEALLRGRGFGEVEHFGPAEAIRTYFGGRPDVRLGMPQRLIVATVGAR
jgi:O-methyltransferase involved in polyketide biosynthesis